MTVKRVVKRTAKRAVTPVVEPALKAAAKPAVAGASKQDIATPAKKAVKRKTRGRRHPIKRAKFALGQVVRHRFYPFRGVIFDIDPVFANSEEWWQSIPADIRPVKDQPYYHLLAENAETEYIAYVSEQNLLPDETREPLRHPQVRELFTEGEDGRYRAVFLQSH